ncbi:translation factor SUA5 [Pseudooceanicola antarcticus]|uniref:Threonylcarbamoyl-AMP synthase n=1 Tax=Pseudooceanicola antarcticus TaxID=1247613 RepID=A0A285ITM9_9RHOB|nr:L-threonylcarbamoyladenylate synthase [Pseudooceanicola antarcticus]PJE31816.1 threonylcarbamoyl-AMP synthase [Pseudooceanicola antarcticus]SNY50456.1 translation factor SUA5 [Pseudooceanicola antarcticus]
MATTLRLGSDSASLDRAAKLLRAGQLVAMPTETVYGLAGDAGSDAAVEAIYAAKGRPSHNPLIAHVGSMQMAESLAEFPPEALALAAAFWPGPLTLVLPRRAGAAVAQRVTAGLPTLALRMPAHPVARALINSFGGPLAAPSANPSGRISPTEPAHVLAGLDGRIGAVVDGGACSVGLESTILAVASDGRVRLLRPGSIGAEEIFSATGLILSENDQAGIEAPGQMLSHYAPRGAVRLDVTTPAPDETLLGFGPVETPYNLSPAGELAEAAARLFALLHQMDQDGVERIAVSPIPETGIGRAINDRLRRAAAPRD